jgi:molybdenum cofactor biosynthesis enzyme MoaA
VKNRNRDKYTFANINLLGNCNADCFFCLGKDLTEELKGKNQLNESYVQWNNFPEFLNKCNEKNIKKIYLTGQTADGLQYKYLKELITCLQQYGFSVGVRTNGYLALSKMKEIQMMDDEIAYTINSLTPCINKMIMGKFDIPEWDEIIPISGDNVRVSIVINKYNFDEIFTMIKYLSKFENIKYIQLRKISTDTRIKQLKSDMDLFEVLYSNFKNNYERKNDYCLAEVFELYGKDVVFWRTVHTSVNSLNYFTDGTISDEYFIVEGYLKELRSNK